MPQPKRTIPLIMNGSVCQNAHAFRSPDVVTEGDAHTMGIQDCPLMEPCFSGQLQGRRLQCAALMGGKVAEYVVGGGTLDGEMREVASGAPFPPEVSGYIDPYADPENVMTDRTEILAAVRGWANMVMYGPDYVEVAGEDEAGSPPTSADPAFRRLVEEDRFETVFPHGVATRVPRDKCRCPILAVGDFCPVHGG